jgi:hypothetical protein
MATITLRREGDREEGEQILFPKGKYRVKLMGYEQREGVGKSKKTGKDRPWSGLLVTLKFVGGENAGHAQDFMLFDGREAQISLFQSAGWDVDEQADQIEVDLDELIGLDLNVFMEINRKGDYNNIVRFEPAPRAKATKGIKMGEPLPNEEPEDEEDD